MTAPLAAGLVWLIAYIVGSIPFGFVVGRAKGVNLFTTGSGNIGATNAGRVLGTKYGILVFVLDFLKGVLPTLFATPLATALHPDAFAPFGVPHLASVGAAAFAFLGHLFPVYLGFRGGKGVATGAGAVLVVAPLPTLIAVLTWVTVALASRMVSLASLAAVAAISGARVALTPSPFGPDAIAGTLFCLVGSLFVVVKHRSNVKRLVAGSEMKLPDSPKRLSALAGLHCLALGLWFGGAAFFNFAAAPAIFASFEKVVAEQPSDRTAGVAILPADADAETKKKLASALAGSAVGPIFPRYFAIMTVCGLIAVVTAWSGDWSGRVHRVRFGILAAALALVAFGWPLSEWVSQLRFDRYAADAAVATDAKRLFGPVHLVSLVLSFVTNVLTGIGLFLAGTIPCERAASPAD
jgi:glycerol-3-phosphate acyltransferase PlsY